MLLSLMIYEPLPSTRAMLPSAFLFDARETSVRFSTQLPIGYGGASIGVPVRIEEGGPLWLPPNDLTVRPRSRVVVMAGSRVLYEGMVAKARYRNGSLSGLELVGYGTADALRTAPFASNDTTARTTGEVIQRVLGAVAPGIAFDPHAWGDPGVSHTLAEFDGMYAGAIIDQLMREGGTDGRIWDFAVWHGPTAQLTPRVIPANPTYRLPVNEVAEIVQDYTGMASTVRVRYRAPGSSTDSTTPDAVDTEFLSRYGWESVVTLEGGELTAVGAAAFRDAMLARLRFPARTLSITADERGLPMPGGTRQPPHLVRAGEWLQLVGDAAPEVITSTEYDSARHAVTVRTGTAQGDFADMFAHVRRVASAVEQRINPVSGGRAR